jgi:hypothetical protein
VRTSLNTWIRATLSSALYDGVVEFDDAAITILSDNLHPKYTAQRYMAGLVRAKIAAVLP